MIAWGDNSAGQCNIPALPLGQKYVMIAAGATHSLLLRSDGTLLAIGSNNNGECNVPELPPFKGYSSISSGANFSVAIYDQAQPWNYCTSKPNSQGCSPAIGWNGSPTITGPIDDFSVTASNVLNRKPGIMLWSTLPAATLFGGGTLCLAPPIVRTPGQASGGSPAPTIDCSGQYSFHFGHAYIQNYFLAAGQTIRAQYWSRDPGFAAPNNIGLTDGLSFTLLP